MSLLGLITAGHEKSMTELGGVALSAQAEESSYAIARFIMRVVDWILSLIGLGDNETVFIWVYSIVVFFIAVVIGQVAKWLVLAVLHRIGPHLKSDIYKYLAQRHFFTKLCRIVPAFVFLILIQFTLNNHLALSGWLTRLSWCYIILILTLSICTFADVVWDHLNARENKRKLPLHGIVQLIKLIAWVMCVIVLVAILVNKSPGSLLAGLGAFAAVLMLIFKDSILGVVAGVQLAENDSLHVGDWIAVPGTDANGTVTEVSLTEVKIQNWDKTTSTVPPYTLITSGFKNYRSMQESNTRRIQRSYMIDADSVVECDDKMLADFAKIPLLKNWIAKKIEQRDSGKISDVSNPDGLVNGSISTNLGVFRAYVQLYLNNSELIDHASDCFVTTLAQTSNGVPLQLYCFTSTSSWIPYEAIQSLIFEHLAVMLYRFELYTFENASARDEVINGYLSSGRPTPPLFGMPYPMYNSQAGATANDPLHTAYANGVDPEHPAVAPVQPSQTGQAAPTPGSVSSASPSPAK